MKNFLSKHIMGILRGALELSVSFMIGLAIGTIGLKVLDKFIPVAPIDHIDPQTIQYTKTFLEYAAKYNVQIDPVKLKNLRINVRPLPWYLNITGKTIGLCEYSSVHIALDSKYWKDANILEREMLVFHELGHCLLDQRHTEGDDHIMNPSIMDYGDYIRQYQKLQDKFFVCSKNCPVVEFKSRRYL